LRQGQIRIQSLNEDFQSAFAGHGRTLMRGPVRWVQVMFPCCTLARCPTT
jgi:hypothetical protein